MAIAGQIDVYINASQDLYKSHVLLYR
jgi:hypothetical protein